MTWLLVVIASVAVCVLAGRAHSRYLDRVEAKSSLKIQLLNVSNGDTEAIASAKHQAGGLDRQTALAISVGNQLWICPQGADEARVISGEGELVGIYDLRSVAPGNVTRPTRSGGVTSPRRKPEAA